MTKVTKRMRLIAEKVDSTKAYEITEAVALLDDLSKTKFKESFDVSINTSNIPDNLTKPKYISSELNNIINSKYAKKVLKEITKTNENKTDRNSPW